MNLRQDIPEDLNGSDALNRQLPPDGRLALRVFGDIDLTGRYGLCVLAADDERLYYGPTDGNGRDGRLGSLPLTEIRGLRVENYIGNGALLVDRADDSVQVARFSQSKAPIFEAAAEQLADAAARRAGRPNDQVATVSVGRSLQKRSRCPQCGRALSRRAEVCLYCADKRKLVLRLLSLLMPYWRVVSLAMALTLSVTALGLVPPYLTAWLIDKAIIPHDLVWFTWLLVIYAGAYVAMGGLNVFRIRLMGWLGQKVIYDLRGKAFSRLQQLSLRYYEAKQTGQLLTRVTTDTERVERFVVEGLQELIIDVLSVAAISVLLFTRDWRLALVTITPMPFIGVMVYFFSRRIKGIYRKAWRTMASLSSHLADIIPGVRVVKGFAREPEEAEKFDRRSRRLFGHRVDAAYKRAAFFPIVTLASQMGYILLWVVGGYLAIVELRGMGGEGQLSRTAATQGTMLGTLFMFTAMLWRFYDPINRLSRLSDQVQRATTSAERVFELLDAFPDVSEPAAPKPLTRPVRGRIEFRDVRFAYEANAPVLDGINLTIEPGEMIGIVGHSGVGKSTLASLLLRFYDPDEGQVLLDGVDVRELGSRDLRSTIGLVLQEPTLFHGSVLENICYSDAAAPPERVIEAAHVANAHHFLMKLPEGYDTQIGERGVRLSQGEKQRISIARAILRDPPILILDEATASVDTETERLIQSALDRLIAGRTVLAIAHRLSTLRNADRIIVLEHGRIAEMGTHRELLAAEGIYYGLCHAQSMLGRDLTESPAVAAAQAVVEERDSMPGEEPEEYEGEEY